MSTPDTACAVFAAATRCARVFPICVLGLNLSPPPLLAEMLVYGWCSSSCVVGLFLRHLWWKFTCICAFSALEPQAEACVGSVRSFGNPAF
ncbi:hypothetical protein ACIS_00380 [Anaplasma centrale str. Israel]|uniref:Uncharacterized protein n=1 Tax=Anaplasma centrale (strain Israel) TaxID=574556 RepID=D1ATZ0_ANACI|nr:hypothetical protein ACIS_00380 [Anaplasma centrale str. Israel]